MVDTSRRARVGLGLIGLGPSWELVYRDTLLRLQNRLTIRVVYDSVEARARSVAGDFDAGVAGSLKQVLQHATLQGILVLDPAWCGPGALSLIGCSRSPVFLGSPVLNKIFDWCFPTGETADPTKGDPSQFDHLMPELGLRFTPASCRLRELIATRLGPAQRIEIESDLKVEVDYLAGLIDWCSSIFGETAVLGEVENGSPSPGFELRFPGDQGSAPSPAVKSALFKQKTNAEQPLTIRVTCEHGQAALTHRTRIHWTTQAESVQETLIEERTETDILIDQFCRRALGGLNPVGQLSDLLKAMGIVRTIRRLGL